jgi:2-hydroxy-3-oxopropionate reductase
MAVEIGCRVGSDMIRETTQPRIAFMGIGLMGEPMAMRLLRAGYPVSVWNRTAEKTRHLVERGARAAHTPSEAAAAATIVITMLADGPSVEAVLFEKAMASAIPAGSVVIDMSSIPPSLARDHANRLHALGIHHLDAPVSGGTKGASDGTLAIMVGGKPSAYETAKPILEVLGRPTWVGPGGSGQIAKLANQAIVAATIGAVAEALLLAAAGGADPAKVREALSGGFADSPILQQHGQRMLDRAWVPGGPMRMQVKDLRTILAVAAELKLELPLSRAVAELFEASQAAGLGDHDHSALLLEIERRNPGIRVGDKPDQRPGNGS